MKTGDVIGTYQIAEKIGEGAMGQVFRGRDIHLDRELAIKVLLPEISSRQDLVNRFKNEALTMAKLHHSNICSLYAFIEHQGEHLMVLQFVEGQTVENLIRERGKLAPDEVMQIVSEILSGLIEAHQHGIVHRDLKPSNLMMTKSGKVVIMDFGIAKATNQVRMTRAGMMVGTLEYASPEQLRGEDVGPQSDLYSLGIVTFELLTGQLPFKAETDYEWIQAHTTEKLDTTPMRADIGDSALSFSLSGFIEKATNKEPSKRFSNASEMLQDLNKIRFSTASSKGVLWQKSLTLFKANPVMSAASLMTVTGLSIFLYAVISPKSVPSESTPPLGSAMIEQPKPTEPIHSSSKFVAPPSTADQPFVMERSAISTRDPAAVPTGHSKTNSQQRNTSSTKATATKKATSLDRAIEQEKAKLAAELGLTN